MLDQPQWRCLEAVLDAIIPPDDFPGAVDAGVGDYLRRQFSGDLAALLPSYQRWLNDLDAESRAFGGGSFAALGLEARSMRCSNALSGARSKRRGRLSRRLSSCKSSSIAPKVITADPGNGGNRDGLSWRMIGYEVSA